MGVPPADASLPAPEPLAGWATQALDSYLDVQAWQIGQIEKSMAEMDAGRGIQHGEIKKELSNWGKGSKAKRDR